METTATKTENQKPSIQEKRAYLKELSAQAKELKESMLRNAKTPQEALVIESLKINDIIVNHFYKDDKNTEFHTFHGWKEKGMYVKKGETAFLVWGRPKAVQEQEKGNQPSGDEEEDTFHPVSFIFSNAQVREAKKVK